MNERAIGAYGVPRIADEVIALPRVADVLNRWAPITIVRGMSGYGKTTQIEAWLGGLRPRPELLWLDASNSDLRGELSAWIRQHPPTPTAWWDTSGRPAPRLVIVIDDADRLLDGESADLVLDLVRRRHHLHVVAASRGHSALQSLADGRVTMSTVPGRQLLFRPEETATLAQQLGVELTETQLARLHDEFGGWPAAVRIVLDEMRNGADGLPITRAERYLRQTVLPDLADSPWVRLSMRFALAERLTHRLIRDLAAGISPQKAIDLLEGLGYIDIRHQADDVELVLPRFVRRALCREFMAAEPESAREMHRRLAAWYASRPGPNHDLHALQHSRAAEDWRLFKHMWTKSGSSLAVSHPAEIEAVLRDLPTPVIKRHPSIAVLRGALAVRHRSGSPATQWAAARLEYGRLAATIKPASLTRMPAPDMLLIGSGRIMDLRRRGQEAEADALADRLTAELSRRRNAGESAGDAASWFYLQRGIADHLRLRPADASRWYQLGWQHRHPPDVSIGRSLASGLALLDVMAGRHEDARIWMRHHRALSGATAKTGPVTDVRIAIAAQLTAVDRLDETAAQMPREIAHAAADSEFWAFAAFAQARRELLFGRPVGGLDILDRARASHPDDRSEAAIALLARANAELLIALGQGHRALQTLNTADVGANPILAAPLAWVHLLSDEPAAARQVSARALTKEAMSVPDRIGLLLSFAIAAVRLGDASAAGGAFAQAAATAMDTGVIGPFALPHKAALAELQAAVGQKLPDGLRRRLDGISSAYPKAVSLVILTWRERQLVTALHRGASRDQMAEQTFVSINTVKKQLVTLYRKLGVSSRADALARLDELGLLDDSESPLLKQRSTKARSRPAIPSRPAHGLSRPCEDAHSSSAGMSPARPATENAGERPVSRLRG